MRSYFLVLVLISASHGSVIVRVQHGELRGTEDVSRGGFKYFSFRGVPYAEAPIGEFRFQDPQPLKNWSHVRGAVEYSSICAQTTSSNPEKVLGSEDCLYLNVFTPQINDCKDGSGLPVLVWIHGGSFKMGAGSFHGPDYLMDKPIVVVTMNYRLGVLVIVRVQHGELRGTEDVSRGGFKYFSFRGVPYAEAPIGEFRFQDPQPLKNWSHVREAVEYSSICAQTTSSDPEKVLGSEDCLYLNVFTPQINDSKDGSRLPVLVWIHGGSFKMGAGSLHGPDYLMDKPIVVVTMNYRLGVLVIVRVQHGELRGTEDVSRSGFKYFSFRGVPYAEAPIGKFRFQDPQPLKNWSHVREAVEYSSICVQTTSSNPEKVLGSEDCLYLNVFTPQINDSKDGSGWPVLVWIHGGSFKMGAGSFYGPDYLMDKPMVVVTINYRLGVLGFLHFDDEHLPGNYGMKDQVAALHWVRNNIHKFGGDYKRVTLAGQSSGGACVHWHMISPASRGLFHHAISLSGTAMAGWAEVPRRIAKDRGLSVARLVGCNYESVGEIVQCLKRTPTSLLMKTQEKFSIWSYYPISFAIVPESEDGSAWKQKTMDVPWLIGFTSNEEELDVVDMLSRDPNLKYLNENYRTIFPIVFLYNLSPHIRTEKEMTDTTEKIKKFYFKSNPINGENAKQLKNLMTDFVKQDTTEAALRHRGATYFYVFDHLPEHSFMELVKKDYKPDGPVHSDDVISLFKISYFPQELNTADTQMSKLMIEIWYNFIAAGNPNSEGLGFKWLPLSESKIEFLNITKEPEMQPVNWNDRFLFWRSLRLQNYSSRLGK